MKSKALPLTLLAIWAAGGYGLAVLIEKYVRSSTWQIVLMVCAMIPLALIVYYGYSLIDSILAKPPDDDTLAFRLKWLYHTRGVPERFASWFGLGSHVGQMDVAAAKRGTRRRMDDVNVRYLRLIAALTDSNGKTFDADKIIEHHCDIQKFLLEIRGGTDSAS